SPVWRGNETKPPSIKVSWSRTGHSKPGSKEPDTAIGKQTAKNFVFLCQDDLLREEEVLSELEDVVEGGKKGIFRVNWNFLFLLLCGVGNISFGTAFWKEAKGFPHALPIYSSGCINTVWRYQFILLPEVSKLESKTVRHGCRSYLLTHSVRCRSRICVTKSWSLLKN
ncbi:hypothetical protein SRHO_G00282020, partial [Serrasalmus rhombeus]